MATKSISDGIRLSDFDYTHTYARDGGERDVFKGSDGLAIVVELEACRLVPDKLVACNIYLEKDGVKNMCREDEAEALQTQMWEKIEHEVALLQSYAYGRGRGSPIEGHAHLVPAPPEAPFDFEPSF